MFVAGAYCREGGVQNYGTATMISKEIPATMGRLKQLQTKKYQILTIEYGLLGGGLMPLSRGAQQYITAPRSLGQRWRSLAAQPAPCGRAGGRAASPAWTAPTKPRNM